MGAPVGNKNATKNRPWAEAINRVLVQNDGKKLRELAETVVDLALSGDIQAIKEVGDRVDGKAAQALTDADGGSLFGPLVEASKALQEKLRG